MDSRATAKPFTSSKQPAKQGLDQALDDFAIGALMYESAAPIAEAGRLVPFSPEYQSVVVNKGATIFHMLRGQLGDSNFFALLQGFRHAVFRQVGDASTISSKWPKRAAAK